MLDAVTLIASQLAVAQAPVAVELPTREVRVAHLIESRADGHDENLRALVVARIPNGQMRIEIDAQNARRLVVNRVPGLDFTLSFEGSVVFEAPVHRAHEGRCHVAASNIATGAIITAADTDAVPCDSEAAVAPLGYDRQSAAYYARQPIANGIYLGPIRPASEDRVRSGAVVTLVTGGDGVSIRREVTTLQPAREGRAVFIRTSDGDVFTVPFANLEKE